MMDPVATVWLARIVRVLLEIVRIAVLSVEIPAVIPVRYLSLSAKSTMVLGNEQLE